MNNSEIKYTNLELQSFLYFQLNYVLPHPSTRIYFSVGKYRSRTRFWLTLASFLFQTQEEKTPLKKYIVRYFGSIHPLHIKSSNKILVTDSAKSLHFQRCKAMLVWSGNRQTIHASQTFLCLWGWLEMPIPTLETPEIRLKSSVQNHFLKGYWPKQWVGMALKSLS